MGKNEIKTHRKSSIHKSRSFSSTQLNNALERLHIQQQTNISHQTSNSDSDQQQQQNFENDSHLQTLTFHSNFDQKKIILPKKKTIRLQKGKSVRLTDAVLQIAVMDNVLIRTLQDSNLV
eukprot:c14942_g1_i1.p1 GENE.c14942_g1_i1~~c14942_g1_i1.p1  ORF type:complete len:130 (-),score=36.17 c14942_g1_i1:54-413(-)